MPSPRPSQEGSSALLHSQARRPSLPHKLSLEHRLHLWETGAQR